VPSCHFVKPALVNQGEEKAVAKVACGCLEVSAPLARLPSNVSFSADELQIEVVGQPLDESFVGIRLGATQPMVEVDDRKSQPHLTVQAPHEVEQKYGIRPTRNGYTHTLARAEHSRPFDLR
jgi:hypothetical protein